MLFIDIFEELNKLLEEQTKLPICIQQIQDKFSKLLRQYKDELKVDFENLRFEVRQFAHLDFSSSTQEATLGMQGRVSSADTKAFSSIENTMETVVSQNQQSVTVADDSNVQTTEKRERSSEGKKCRVEWKFETPGVWNLIEMQEALLKFSMLLQPWFEIQFVYVGSLVIKAFVQKHVLDDRDKMRNSVLSFLEKFVEVCKISTNVSTVIKIDLMIELNELDFEEIKTEIKMSKAKDKTTCIFCSKSFDCQNCQQKDKIILGQEEEKYEEEIKLMILKAEQEINGESTEHTPESGNVSSSRIYYARIEYAVKSVIPNMIKDLLKLIYPKMHSYMVGEKLTHSGSFRTRVKAAEWEQILSGYGYFDMQLVARILDQLLHEEFKIYKRYCHDILHTLNLSITSRRELNESFDDFHCIAKGFEHVLQKDQDELVSKIEALRRGSMDSYLDDENEY